MNLLKDWMDRLTRMGDVKGSDLNISSNELIMIKKFAYGNFYHLKKLIKIEHEFIAEVKKHGYQNSQKSLLARLGLYIIHKIVYLEMVMSRFEREAVGWNPKRNIIENIFYQISAQKIDKYLVQGTDLEIVFDQLKDCHFLKRLICYNCQMSKELSLFSFKKRGLNDKINTLLNQIINYELARSKNLSF